MVTDVAFIEVQLRVALWPAVMLPGLTDKVMVGTIPPTIRLVELPPQPMNDEMANTSTTRKLEQRNNRRIQELRAV